MLLVPLMLVLVTIGIFLFSWAVKSGQYDDLEGPAHRILYDDDEDMIPAEARVDKQQQTETPPDGDPEGKDTGSGDKADRS